MSGRLILASASPRRRELLAAARFDFEVEPAEIDEDLDALFDEGDDEGGAAEAGPEACVRELAARKALEVWARHPDAWVLGADTLVVRDGVVFAKPEDRDDAREMLRALSGGWHEVWTGVVLCGPDGAMEELAVCTKVRFRELSEPEIEAYLAVPTRWSDKAGAYGIQAEGGAFVAELRGSKTNVIGLPMEQLEPRLRAVLAPSL
ncbi:MAG: septum formation protein Maf [Planctomycetes bacterium]|nr:septum formation protein Maf [Planctomycetota bacterium]